MARKKSVFNWKCPHCQHRNKAMLDMEFEMPRYYWVNWKCDECGKESKLEWSLTVNGWPEKRRPPKLRKRKKEKKKLKCDHDWIDTNDHPGGTIYWRCKKCKETSDVNPHERDEGTKKDRAYVNNHGTH